MTEIPLGANDSFEPEELRRRLLRDGTLVLDVKVIPRARSGEIQEVTADGRLKIKVRAAPEKGSANEEVCVVLAEFFAVPKKNVGILSGHSSPRKRVRIVRSPAA